jgi:hypothetical protein
MNEPVAPVYVADDGDTIAFGVPFTKVNVKERTVEGFATLDNVDKAFDVVDSKASEEAFSSWMGNIREMHGPKAVGSAVTIEKKTLEKDGRVYTGIWVKSRISKGAPDTWEKVLDGTLKGYSIGGKVLERRPDIVKASDGKYAEARVNRITKYILAELSVVDNPMNPLAMLEGISKGALIKMEGDELVAGDAAAVMSGLFYCNDCDIAKVDATDSIERECVTCDQKMVRIGDVAEAPSTRELKKMVSAFFKAEVCPACGETSMNENPKMCLNGHPMPGTVAGPSGETTMKADREDAADEVAGDEDESMDDGEAGFGVPGAGEVPELNDVKPDLLTETGLPNGTPQTDSPAPHAEKADSALATQTAEGNSFTVTIDPEEVGKAVIEALKSRSEFTGRSRVDKYTQDQEYVAALLEVDMYRAVTNAHKTPPKGYPTDSNKYGDPENHKYPLDTPGRVRSAMSYFNAPGQRVAGGYSMSKWASIGRRIASAANSTFGAGHTYSNGRVSGPGMKKSDIERGEFIINLQKNASDANNNVVNLLHSLVGYLNDDDDTPSINKGGDTTTLDTKELEKILDILETATREVGDVLKGFSVERLNSETASGPTVGGSDPGDAGVGTVDANDGGAPMATAEVEVATNSSLPTPDNGPDKVVPNAISTDGAGVHEGITADSGPEKVLPHADLASTSATTKDETAEETKEVLTEDLIKAVLTKVEEGFTALDGRLSAVENSGGGKKSLETGDEKIEKSDTTPFWGGILSADELKNND